MVTKYRSRSTLLVKLLKLILSTNDSVTGLEVIETSLKNEGQLASMPNIVLIRMAIPPQEEQKFGLIRIPK